MRRHQICLGDTTTTGGVVVSATSNFTILGRPAALEGDTVECKACKSTGVITCAGPRHPASSGGRKLALEGNLCACRCPRPPELVASQQASYQTLDSPGAVVCAVAIVLLGSVAGSLVAESWMRTADDEMEEFLRWELR